MLSAESVPLGTQYVGIFRYCVPYLNNRTPLVATDYTQQFKPYYLIENIFVFVILVATLYNSDSIEAFSYLSFPVFHIYDKHSLYNHNFQTLSKLHNNHYKKVHSGYT